jgi:hypothetical protein
MRVSKSGLRKVARAVAAGWKLGPRSEGPAGFLRGMRRGRRKRGAR